MIRNLRVTAALTFILTCSFAVGLAGASAPSDDGVPGLELCGSMPHCYYGPIYAHFPNYRNVCSNENCFFVAAADWEVVGAGVTTSPSTLQDEYSASGQTFNGGLSPQVLWNYWRNTGINSLYLTNLTSASKDEASIEKEVKAKRAVIAEFITSRTSLIGINRFSAGIGVVVADGYTPKGPLVVFQGSTMQMTWEQWGSQIRSVWVVSVSSSPVSGATAPTTTTTTTIPSIPASDYGPQNETYQTYGNVYPADLGDCTFAGAANWEQIVLGADPDPTVIGYEFAEAGGSATDGLTIEQLFNYWYDYGISGYFLHQYFSYYTTQSDVENGVRDYVALIAVLNFVNGDFIGNEQVTAGSHVVVVDGYTPEGPLVVTWGTTIQMSWQQWNVEATAMYGIDASSNPN